MCRVTNMEPIILDIVYIIKKNMYAKLANIQARLFNKYLGLFLGPNTIHLAIHSKIVKMPPIITVGAEYSRARKILRPRPFY